MSSAPRSTESPSPARMPDATADGPFDHLPVQLPSDVKRTGPSKVVTTMAVLTLIVGVAVGALYERFWQTASHDVKRILPASTLMHVHSVAPPEGISAGLALEHLKPLVPTAALEQMLEVLPKLPMGPFFDLLSAADDLHFAMVPGPDALGFLVFVEIRDESLRRRYEDRLAQLMEPVDRELGFTVHALKASAQGLPWSPKTLPFRMVSMRPWVIFNFGAPETLSDLLSARVAGTARPIRTRAGYSRMAKIQPDKSGGVVAYLDPGALHDALRAPGKETLPGAVIEIRRALLVDGIQAFTAHSQISPATQASEGASAARETLDITAHFTEGEGWPLLTQVFSTGDHEWLADIPQDAEWAMSLAFQPLATMGPSIAAIVGRLQREFGRALRLSPVDAGFDGVQLLSDLRAALLRPDVAGALEPIGGLARLASLPATATLAGRPPKERWILAVTGTNPQALMRSATTLANALALDDNAVGELQTPGGPVGLIIAQSPPQERLVAERDGDRQDQSERLAWRVRGARLEIAPSRAVFEAFDGATQQRRTLGDSPQWSQSQVPTDASGLILLDPELLARSGPLGEAIASALTDQTRLVGALSIERRDARLSVNIGTWTALLALARAPRRILDRLVTPDLSERCRDAFDAVCAWDSELPTCRLLAPRRGAILSRACQHLTVAPPI